MVTQQFYDFLYLYGNLQLCAYYIEECELYHQSEWTSSQEFCEQ